jgi:hypothetical protein
VGGEDIREKPLLEREEILKGLMPRDPRQCGAAAPDAAEWWDNFKNTLWDSMERLVSPVSSQQGRSYCRADRGLRHQNSG